jgi:hypothetical protein
MQRLHLVFLVIKLTLLPPDQIKGHEHPMHPDPEIVDGDEEYEVEEILNSCVFTGNVSSTRSAGTVMVPSRHLATLEGPHTC